VPATEVAEELLRKLGVDGPDVNRLRFQGPDVVLPSAFRVTDFAAACVGVTAVAAARVEGLGADHPLPPVDTRGAAAVFRSERYLRRDGAPLSGWDELSGYYRCADGGWIQLHCNFSHHRRGVLDLLGCADNRVAVDRTIATRWAAQELEDTLAERGMCSARLRTRDEWLAHPHGRAVAGQPLIEITRIGDAPARQRPTTRPLAGVRVLDLTRVIAGPTCGRVLAQHGAHVLRVGADHLPVVEPCVIDTGFGKRATHLDLRTATGVDAAHTLLEEADVFVQGFRPGALAGLGLGLDDVASRAPGVVHVSLSAYGHCGPWASRRGFDSLAQTASGIGAAGAAAAGEEGTRPLPCQALDHGTGWLLAAATMVALDRQRTEGGTWSVRGSLAQTGHFLAELGQVDHLDHPDPTHEDVADLMVESESVFGRLHHVAAQGRLDGQRHYDGPPVRLGSSPARWW
jgi:crotonobetainyl-CoA:carnitine CoA-transferase CaiB-like acyl-CoA transferase